MLTISVTLKRSDTKQLAQQTRSFRKLHRWVGVPLFVFLFLVGTTGLLLGWKKHVDLLPPTQKGVSATPTSWLPIDSLYHIGQRHAQVEQWPSSTIDRIDIRPGKGIAKIVYADHYNEVQIDCQTGVILSVARRHSDFFEQLHDGSLLDRWLQTGNGQLKLVYTTSTSVAMILLSLSGFYLWYNPRRIRRRKRRS